MLVAISDNGFIDVLSGVALRVNELDIDLEDGRDLTIELTDARPEYLGAWWIAEYKFPQLRDAVLALFPRVLYNPTDSDE